MTKKPTYDELLDRISKLEESERKFRSLADNSSDLLYRTDFQGKINYISGSVLELSGYTHDETIGMNMAEEVYLVPSEREQFLAKLQNEGKVTNFEAQLKRKNGSTWWAATSAHFYTDENGKIAGVEGITRDISELKLAQQRQGELIFQLKDALDKVKTLSGLLPICSSCKKIRDDKGYWNQIEGYIRDHAEVEFSHGLCPGCSDELYGDQIWYDEYKEKRDKCGN